MRSGDTHSPTFSCTFPDIVRKSVLPSNTHFLLHFSHQPASQTGKHLTPKWSSRSCGSLCGTVGHGLLWSLISLNHFHQVTLNTCVWGVINPRLSVVYEHNLLLFLWDVLLDGSQSDQAVAALQQSAGCQVPLILLLQTGVLRAQVGHLLLQLLYPSSLPFQQLLLGLDDLVKLLQIFDSPGRVLGRAFHCHFLLFGRCSSPMIHSRSPREIVVRSPGWLYAQQFRTLRLLRLAIVLSRCDW